MRYTPYSNLVSNTIDESTQIDSELPAESNSYQYPSKHYFEEFQQNNSKTRLWRLGEHNQHDQSPVD